MLLEQVIGRNVRCFAGYDSEVTMHEGEVVGYVDAPTIVVRLADGTRVHWRADLTELFPAPGGRITHKECGCVIGQECSGHVCQEPTNLGGQRIIADRAVGGANEEPV